MENTFLEEIFTQHRASNKNFKSLLFGTSPSKTLSQQNLYTQASEIFAYPVYCLQE